MHAICMVFAKHMVYYPLRRKDVEKTQKEWVFKRQISRFFMPIFILWNEYRHKFYNRNYGNETATRRQREYIMYIQYSANMPIRQILAQITVLCAARATISRRFIKRTIRKQNFIWLMNGRLYVRQKKCAQKKNNSRPITR